MHWLAIGSKGLKFIQNDGQTEESAQVQPDGIVLAMIPGGFRLHGQEFDLAGYPHSVLKAFVESRFKRLTAGDLIKSIWPDGNGNNQTLKVHISTVRAALKDARQKTNCKATGDPIPCIDHGEALAWELRLDELK
jgi:DNA-binding response OmpR family regulator